MKTKMRAIQKMPFLVPVALLCLMVTPARAVPIVSLDIQDPTITVGETFDVRVSVQGSAIGQDLLGFGFDVGPLTTLSLVTYNGFSTGPLFTPTSGTGTFVSDIAFPGITDDTVLLATLSFTANGPGTDLLGVTGTFDGLFHGLFYESQGFDITASRSITVREAVPDSDSFWVTALTLLGLCGLAHYNRERGRTT